MKRTFLIICACAWMLAGCGEDDPQVTISGFAPSKTAAGSIVVIAGTYFDPKPEKNTVRINGTEAEVVHALPGILHVKVPVLATSGPISVSSNGNAVTTQSLEIVTAEGSWEKKADFPSQWRALAASFSYNGFGYVGLGYAGVQMTDFWKYNPVTDQWTQLNDPTINELYAPFNVYSSFVEDGVAYLLCFATQVNTEFMMSYNIEQDEWSFMGSIPQGIDFHRPVASYAYNGKGIIGYPWNNDITNDFLLPIYDIHSEAEKWSFSPLIPTPGSPIWFSGSKAFSYSIGGLSEYDLETETWQVKPVSAFPYIINISPVMTTLNTSVYIAMGNTNYIQFSDVWRYTPDTDSWHPVTPCPYIRGNPVYFTIDNKAYYVFGQNEEGNSVETVMLTP